MKHTFLSVFLVLGLGLGALELDKTPAPPWVLTDAWTPPAADSDAEGDYEDLLKDVQTNRLTHETYYRFAYRLLTPQAVQDSANFSIDWVPEYQRAKLHSLVVWRNGVRIDQTSLPFRRLQREKNLEEGLYDGTETWVAFLKDVQPGDVFESAFTIEGENPIFEGKYADEWRLESSYALEHFRFRIVSKPGASPEIRTFGTEVLPSTRSIPGGEETVLTFDRLPALRQDAQTPYDARIGGRLVVSDWKSWAEVVQWAIPAYSPQITPRVKALAQTLTQGLTEPAERAQALLRYVQDQIRYLGIEVGPNSHVPHSPDTVLTDGYGDCKDKSLLFCSLAAAVGLDAWPVFVNTRTGGLVPRNGPSVLAFNHVIAAIDGATSPVFVDPTLDFQGAQLSQQILGPYLYGLEIKAGTTDLTALPGPSLGHRDLVQTYHFDSYTGPGTVDMEYSYGGWDAVDQRRQWARRVIADWKKETEEELHDRHGASRLTAGPQVIDDRQTNIFRVKFSYEVDQVWGSDAPRQAFFYPWLIGEMLYDPTSVAARQSPYSREHPVRVTQTRRIHLPTDWSDKPTRSSVSAPSFSLTIQSRLVTPRLYEFSEVYTSTFDRVQPGQWTLYLKKLKEARNEIAWTLTAPAERAAQPVVKPDGWGYGLLAFTTFALVTLFHGGDF